jgi:hypothetical protein
LRGIKLATVEIQGHHIGEWVIGVNIDELRVDACFFASPKVKHWLTFAQKTAGTMQ